MKEFTIHGTVMQCYPLTAAQRLHNYTIRYCPKHQVLNIGTGLYVQLDLDFTLLKEVIYQVYERQDSMRLRFLQDTDGTVYQYVVPFEEREIPFYDFSRWKEADAHDEMRKWTAVPFQRLPFSHESGRNGKAARWLQRHLSQSRPYDNGFQFHYRVSSKCVGVILCKTIRYKCAEAYAILS